MNERFPKPKKPHPAKFHFPVGFSRPQKLHLRDDLPNTFRERRLKCRHRLWRQCGYYFSQIISQSEASVATVAIAFLVNSSSSLQELEYSIVFKGAFSGFFNQLS